MDAHQARFIAEAGGNPRDLPGWMVMSLGGGHAIAGKADAAIALLEPIMERKPDPRLIDAQNDLALEFRQLLAHAYQQQGRAADAEDQLAAIDVALQSAWDQGFGRNPTAIARWAVNDSMRGRRESARTRLQQAVDSGWREIAMVRHDPRWASLRDDPEAGAVLQRVDADVARMRQAALETLAASGLLAQLQAG
jgi:tetratricopeptide (TPR) repeat protein